MVCTKVLPETNDFLGIRQILVRVNHYEMGRSQRPVFSSSAEAE